MSLAVKRAVTAAVERAGIAAVRALNHDVVGQFGYPRGAAWSVAEWAMAHRPPNRHRHRWVVSLLDVQPAGRVLEVGFGPGLAIAELSRRVGGTGHVYDIDHSGVMPQQAARHNAAAIRAGRVTLARTSADQLPPAPSGLSDAVLAVNSLGFWPAPAELFQELRRLLTPGGGMAIASQRRCPGATASTSLNAAREIEDLLRDRRLHADEDRDPRPGPAGGLGPCRHPRSAPPASRARSGMSRARRLRRLLRHIPCSYGSRSWPL